jgi:serine/threonine protein kinase
MSEGLDRIKPGDQVGPYRIIRGFKSRGGMARIFEVEVREKYRRPDLPRRLALKVAKPEHQAALTAEADFLSRFSHPSVVRIFPLPGYHRPVYAAREQFSFGWGWYYAMELLDGGSLERRLTRPTTITGVLRPPQEGGRCLSLLEAKPSNVLFRRRRFRYLRSSVPQVVLCDFGISRDLRYPPRTDLLGMVTPEYMSPEQALEKGRHRVAVNACSDLFSLGIVFYEMLTGDLPFEDLGEIVDPTHFPPPPRQLRPSIPPALDDVVMRALAKEPSRRFQSASEMRRALGGLSMPFDWGAAARRTFAVASVGVTLAACLAAGGYGTMRVMDSVKPTPRPTAPPAVSTATATPTPIAEPATPAPTLTPTVSTREPTCTPAPTLTPTNTPLSTPTVTATQEDG